MATRPPCPPRGQTDCWTDPPLTLRPTKPPLRHPTPSRLPLWKPCLLLFCLQLGSLAMDHSPSQLAYEEDEIRLILGQPSSKSMGLLDDGDGVSGDGNRILSFHPHSLDFKESPVGIPRLGIVRVDNRLTDENLKLISISGSTLHFHSSFFADKVMSPGTNTTFEVVFLGRAEGRLESNLFIHTSKGLFKYHVEGYGLPSPYRLRPLVGALIPLNGTYEPLITMHNPHSRPIQVVEMESSGTELALSLPDGVPEEGEGAAWAIEPFQTKPVMKGTFQGRAEGNHSGYIKIRVKRSGRSAEYLLVPVEVQVSGKPGLYCPQDGLDFGLMVRTDKPRTLSLSLINAHEEPVTIQSVSVKGDPNSAVRFEFRPILIEPDAGVSTVVALVTFDPWEAGSGKEWEGSIEMRSEAGDVVRVPFHARLLQGDLIYNASALAFPLKAPNHPDRNFSVRNTFPVPVGVYEVTPSHPDLLQVRRFKEGHVLGPGERKALFALSVQPDLCAHLDPASPLHIRLRTNVTEVRMGVRCYDGALELHTREGGEVKFGRVELYSTATEYFSVGNENPVEIRLKSWGSNTSWAVVDLVGMQKGPKEDILKIQDFDGLKKSLFLPPGHMAVFSIQVRRPSLDGLFWAESFLTTDQNQTLRLPFTFTVSKGALHPDTIHFDKAFPGKVCAEKLQVSSSFNESVGLRGVWSSPPAPVWFTSSSVQDKPDIPPGRRTSLGRVHFDPAQFCLGHCYAGFLIGSPLGQDWVSGSEMGWETGERDWRILKRLQARYEEVKDSVVSNMSVWLETSAGRDFKLPTSISYTWPRLTSSKVTVFPLTALQNTSYVDIPITNPTTAPLFVQALLASHYPPNWERFVQGNGVGGNRTAGKIVFGLKGLGSSSSQSTESTVMFGAVQRQIVHDLLGLPPPEPARSPGLFFLLPPGATFQIRALFRPFSKELASTLLLIRNNMTGMETMWLKGRGGTGQLSLGNGMPGSSLLFQITDKLLQGCTRESAKKYVPPQLTVRRSFVARNVGEIGLDVRVVEIHPAQGSLLGGGPLAQGDSCEGYGYRILNCHPFTLLPNQTHSIDIAFTPDFTSSRVIRSLRLTDASGLHFNYTLVAMIPSGMLGLCSSIITRPGWEPLLKLFLLAGVGLGLAAAALMAYFEAGSIVSSAVVATVRVLPHHSQEGAGGEGELEETTTPLDLKAVYEKVENRFKRSQQELNEAKSPALPPPPPAHPHPTLRNRKKGNGGKGGRGGPTEPSADLHPTPGRRKWESGKKKRGGKSGTGPPPPTSPLEEENSSTTTESSNPDDFNSHSMEEGGGRKRAGGKINQPLPPSLPPPPPKKKEAPHPQLDKEEGKRKQPSGSSSSGSMGSGSPVNDPFQWESKGRAEKLAGEPSRNPGRRTNSGGNYAQPHPPFSQAGYSGQPQPGPPVTTRPSNPGPRRPGVIGQPRSNQPPPAFLSGVFTTLAMRMPTQSPPTTTTADGTGRSRPWQDPFGPDPWLPRQAEPYNAFYAPNPAPQRTRPFLPPQAPPDQYSWLHSAPSFSGQKESQRARADPFSRNQTGTPSFNRNTWTSRSFCPGPSYSPPQEARQPLSPISPPRSLSPPSSPWPSCPPTPPLPNMEAVFGGWTGRGPGEIWDNPTGPEWTGNYLDEPLDPSLPPLPPLRLAQTRTRAELVQGQREVEAGLGFNPFTSNIWSSSELSWTSPPTTAPSSLPPFRYKEGEDN